LWRQGFCAGVKRRLPVKVGILSPFHRQEFAMARFADVLVQIKGNLKQILPDTYEKKAKQGKG
jgi:hypothetical protein